MDYDNAKYNKLVADRLIASQIFDISLVSKLESLNTFYFVQEDYQYVEKLIKENNIKAIKELKADKPNTGEILDILFFENQNQEKFIVTIYDNNFLEQDPAIIKVYALDFPIRHPNDETSQITNT